MPTPPRDPPPDRSASRLRWAVLGTLLVHVALAMSADVARRYAERPAPQEPPTVELVDIAVPPPPPPPPPPPEPEPEPEPEPPPPQPVAIKAPRNAPPQRAATTTEPPPTETPPPTSPDPGGSPTVALPNAPPAARGVAVRQGPVATGKTGAGGQGGGTGSGDGSGAGSGPRPVSVAMLKTQAMPKGDYSYFDARKDYPAEARQLGIEGKIRVRLQVSAEGKVTSAALLNKLGHGLDEIALAQAKRLEFQPATDTNDRPVPSLVVWTFTFTLPSST